VFHGVVIPLKQTARSLNNFSMCLGNSGALI
jgi:hypothetical protein